MKHGWIVFVLTFVLGLFVVAANTHALDEEALKAEIKKEIKEELKAEEGPLAGIQDHIKLSGLIEVGAVWQDIEYEGATPTEPEDETDLCLTTVELTAEAEINKWVNVAATFLYEDPTFDEETSVDIDVATVTIGNTEEYPLYCTAGKMYVPFGALLTHFPDDPLLDAPLTLLLGETLEKAFLVGVEHQGFSVSAYAFNGDVDEFGEDNNIEGYGLDANYSVEDLQGVELLVGGSYISNLIESDILEERVEDIITHYGLPGDTGLKDYVDGAAGYVHVGFEGFFVDGEYMTALDELELETTAGVYDTDAEPSVWNVEVGYNYDWGKNLEIVLKYAGSDEGELIGLPEERYGICLNQELYKDVIASLGYLYDDYEDDDIHTRDDRDVVFAQIAVEF